MGFSTGITGLDTAPTLPPSGTVWLFVGGELVCLYDIAVGETFM